MAYYRYWFWLLSVNRLPARLRVTNAHFSYCLPLLSCTNRQNSLCCGWILHFCHLFLFWLRSTSGWNVLCCSAGPRALLLDLKFCGFTLRLSGEEFSGWPVHRPSAPEEPEGNRPVVTILWSSKKICTVILTCCIVFPVMTIFLKFSPGVMEKYWKILSSLASQIHWWGFS